MQVRPSAEPAHTPRVNSERIVQSNSKRTTARGGEGGVSVHHSPALGGAELVACAHSGACVPQGVGAG